MQEAQEIVKPCPFCGSNADCIDEDVPEGYYAFIVHCRMCYARTANFKTYEEAVALWNKRTKDGSNDKCNNEHTDGAVT